MTRSLDHRVATAVRPAETTDTAYGHPLIRRVEHFAGRVLLPRALDTDLLGVTRETISALGSLGALNHLAPPEFGGAALGRDDDRRLHELLAYACFNTWLVWAQHAPTVERITALRAEGVRHPLAEQVLRGETLIGAGVSDVRAYPERYISATRAGADGGWRFDGTISWVSGWGLNSALLIAAVEAGSEQVVLALVPVGPRMRATHLDLAAVGGSRTRRVRLDDITVPEEHVLAVKPLREYLAGDRSSAADARGHVFGLARRVLDELRAERNADTDAVVERWAPHVAALRERAYALSDEAAAAEDRGHRLQERIELKVAAGEALTVLSRTLIIARSGRGLTGDDTAQLHARSALFVLVQGQTAEVRSAQLAAIARADLGGTPEPDRQSRQEA